MHASLHVCMRAYEHASMHVCMRAWMHYHTGMTPIKNGHMCIYGSGAAGKIVGMALVAHTALRELGVYGVHALIKL